MDYKPEGLHSVTTFLAVKNADAVLEFAKNAFGAKEITLLRDKKGTLMHAQFQIGDTTLMLGDPMDKPGMTAMLYLYVPDCDAVFKKAVAAGGTPIQEPADQFYGDRSGAVKDPTGNIWWIATFKEKLTMEEISKRAEKMSC